MRVYLSAEIAAGTAFRLGPDPADHLDAGNVLADASFTGRAAPISNLWVDLSCDLMDLTISLGSSAGAGILSKAEAGTLTATLLDVDGRYDPLNPDTPFALGGRTRLTPGVRVCAWAEVIFDPTAASPSIRSYPLFSGTADRWSQAWTNVGSERAANLIATDPTKLLSRSDKPALPSPIGAGDTPLTRLGRIIANAGWAGTVQGFGNTVATLAATTLAQSAWELVNRTSDDELGFVYFIPQLTAAATDGVMAIVAREVWNQRPAPTMTIGCGAGNYDIAVETVPASFDEQLHNAVYAARAGGTQQTAKVQSSIDKYWEQSLQRTDLGLADDAQVALWAQTIVALYAYPQTSIDRITLRPDVHPQPWDAWQRVLGKGLVTGLVRVLWEAAGYTVDTSARVVGWTQRITPDEWTTEWRTVSSAVSSAAYTFHLGPHAQDVLDAGFVLA